MNDDRIGHVTTIMTCDYDTLMWNPLRIVVAFLLLQCSATFVGKDTRSADIPSIISAAKGFPIVGNFYSKLSY